MERRGTADREIFQVSTVREFPMYPSLREQLINPKKCPATDGSTALCIYLTSPNKDDDSPISISDSIKRLNDKNQRVRNAQSSSDITWKSQVKVALTHTPQNWVPRWTLWVEAHGAPMWFFGAEPTLASERLGTRDFAAWVRGCEAANNLTFASVVLDSCFSAAELCPASNRTISPARAVSILLPDKEVLGYLGKNNSATVTGLAVGSQPSQSLSLTEGTASENQLSCRSRSGLQSW